MSLRRRHVVQALCRYREGVAIVSGLGASTYDCAAAGDSPFNFYLWGGMGGAASVGLGLALACPERRVLVVTGDGELTMGLGSLAVIANEAPSNLGVLVLDNESFGETGGQAGLTGGRLDLAAVAQSVGFRTALTVTHPDALTDALASLVHLPGPILVTAKVELSDDPVALPSKDGAYLVRRFRNALDL